MDLGVKLHIEQPIVAAQYVAFAAHWSMAQIF